MRWLVFTPGTGSFSTTLEIFIIVVIRQLTDDLIQQLSVDNLNFGEQLEILVATIVADGLDVFELRARHGQQRRAFVHRVAGIDAKLSDGTFDLSSDGREFRKLRVFHNEWPG